MVDELAEAERAYERGDFAEARRHARLVGDEAPEEARARAKKILAGTGPDRAALTLLVIGFLLLLGVAIGYLGH